MLIYRSNPMMLAVAFVFPAPPDGHETVIAVLAAVAGIGAVKLTTNGCAATRTPAGKTNVYVCVPVTIPVSVTLTGNAVVDPEAVIVNPVT